MMILNFKKLNVSGDAIKIVNQIFIVFVIFFLSLAVFAYQSWDMLNLLEGETLPGQSHGYIFAVSAGITILALTLLVYFIFRLIKSIDSTLTILDEVSAGKMQGLSRLDEKGQLVAINSRLKKILEDRIAVEQKYKDENQSLSNAVVGLLHAVNRLSQKDLTARVEVTEDLTAPIAESLNILAEEISEVLKGVVSISNEVSEFCHSVKVHSDTVIKFADEERKEVETANSELNDASVAMVKIAELAKACSQSADQAIETTTKAKNTVVDTVEGIKNIRDIIRETEKRIKRLGERSQEISSIVNLINSIAERTHILALNASIHAASTGEAGKGFVVIADEVQRLAENAREATGLIASLVNNIQAETGETVTIMNNVISEVVSGTKLATEADTQMQDMLSQTSHLVNMVQQIAETSDQQINLAKMITERAKSISNSTQKTNKELQEQSVYVKKLVEYSSGLVNAVGVFKLSETDKTNSG